MKKTISILLIVMMVLTLGLSTLLVSAAETEAPGADITSTWTGTHKTEAELEAEIEGADFTAITNYAEFDAITSGTADAIKYYFLDLSGDDDGVLELSDKTHLDGTYLSYVYFDFNGYTVDVSGVNNALFNTITNTTIKNLKMTGTLYLRSASWTGAGYDYKCEEVGLSPLVAGHLSTGSGAGVVNLDNIVSDVDITISAQHAGGKKYSGLFPSASSGSTIKNCVYEGTMVVETDTANAKVGKAQVGRLGAIVAEADGATIENCKASGSLTINDGIYFATSGNGNGYVGGIAGYANGTTISNCQNDMAITVNTRGYASASDSAAYANGYIGGIVGYIGTTATSVDNCTNTGTLTANHTVGGIIGASNSAIAVTDSVNSGTVSIPNAMLAVSVDKTTTNVFAGAGGIIGHANAGATVTGCENSGDVTISKVTATGTVTGEDANKAYATIYYGAGGIVGTADGALTVSGNTNTNEAVVTSCASSNYKDSITYTSAKASGKWGVSGGIVGVSIGHADLDENTNNGEIHAYYNSTGGILGFAGSTADIDNCHNTGLVQNGTDVGGIIARASNGLVTVDECTNTGTIKEGCRLGGIAGRVATIEIKNCVNGVEGDADKGKVTGARDGQTYIGGIGGAIDSVAVSGCENYGSVSANGVKAIGGIAGQVFANIDNCTNYGAVTNTNGFAGGIIGKYQGNKSFTNNNNYGAISGTTYAGGIIGYTDTALTISGNNNYGDVEGNYAGGILGYSAAAVEINDCHNEGAISSNSNAAGMIGQCDGKITVNGGSNSGYINAGKGNAGGVVGYVQGDVSVYNFTNSGNAIGNNNAAGIVAYVAKDKNITTIIDNCVNTGNMTSGFRAAGMVGWNSGPVTITNCTNGVKNDAEKGVLTITTADTWSGAGGMIGYSFQGSVTVKGCTNYGNVVCTALTGGANKLAAVGGIVGKSVVPVVIGGSAEGEGCANYGAVGSATYYGGGILGLYEGNSTLTVINCTNDGAVTAQTAAGGIVGYTDRAVYFENCVNGGKVTATNGNAGGIISSVSGACEFINCSSNANSAVSGKNAGGIIGELNVVPTTFKNISNAGTVNGTNCAGGIIGVSWVDLTLTGVTNSGDVTSTGKWAGGIVGYIPNLTITGVINTGNVTSNCYAGGIAGQVNGTAVIKNCINGRKGSNKGAIRAAGTNGTAGAIGGIVGNVSGNATISGCTNYGTVSNGTSKGTAKFVGGIVGQVGGDAEIDDCDNEGDIFCYHIYNNQHENPVGGIVGRIDGTNASTITNCNNRGNITVGANNVYDGKSAGTSGAGGIMGVASKYVAISSCANYGDIGATDGVSPFAWAMGGIVGKAQCNISNCTNEGNISGAYWVGGIVAYAGAKIEITDCTNSGDLSLTYATTVAIDLTDEATDNDASVTNEMAIGGIIGRANAGVTVKNCTNTGDVTLNATAEGSVKAPTDKSVSYTIYAIAGGVVGFSNGALEIDNSHNEGNINSDVICTVTKSGNKTGISQISHAGGIVGYVNKAVTLTGCTNSGDVTVSGSVSSNYAGGVLGYAEINNTNTLVKVENCSNSGAIEAKANYFHVGGVIGGVYRADLDVLGCTNSGSVKAYAAGGTMRGVGGIIGYSNECVLYVENCVNSGSVSETGADASNNMFIGGIVGRLYTNAQSATITNCVNEGAVSGGRNGKESNCGAGGILGTIQSGNVSSLSISNCQNYGTIDGKNSGGIMGTYYINDGTCTATITGCDNYGTVKAADGAGGILAGRSGNGKGTIAVTNCNNYGTIDSAYCAGGIVAKATIAGVIIENCTNHEDATVKGQNAGGILGYASVALSASEGVENILSGCVNNGRVEGEVAGGYVGLVEVTLTLKGLTNYGEVKGHCVGGILGRATKSVTIQNCVNDATIIGSNIAGASFAKSFVGGIAGELTAGGTVDGCSTTANSVVKNTCTTTGTSYIGGIVGKGNSKPTVKNCVANGKVVVDGLSTPSDAYVAGIVGHTNGGTYENCTNNATITVTNSAKLGGIGGIVGRTNAGVSLDNCDNTADISVDADSVFGVETAGWGQGVGGIAGNGNGFTFKNCDNSGNIQVKTAGAVGGIHGYADGAITITNCTNSGTVSGTTYAGGFLGYTTAVQNFSGLTNKMTVSGATAGGILGYSTKAANITNCHNEADITGIDVAGGIAGQVSGGTISGCTNKDGADIKISGAPTNSINDSYAAGIVAIGANQVENCTVYGTVTADGASAKRALYIAGVVGIIRDGGLVKGCANYATVTAKNSTNFVGAAGVLASIGWGANVEDCHNHAKVSVESTVTFKNHDDWGNSVAGILAKGNYNISIKGCTNNGIIEELGAKSDGDVAAGGIMGYFAAGKVTISNCVNNGPVSSTAYSGGILGQANQRNKFGHVIEITDCDNTVAINGAKVAGGIVGLAFVNYATITDCNNSGAVEGDTVGGIAGKVYDDGSDEAEYSISNCTNSATVTSTRPGGAATGGIVGWGAKTMTITNCQNLITATIYGGEAGGIIGYTTDGTLTITNCSNAAEITGGHTAGGFGGYIKGNLVVSSFNNSGDVTCTSDWAGGFVGCVNGTLNISGTEDALLVNSGNVSANKYAGGFVGRVNGATTFAYLKNTGTIKITSGYDGGAGGIIGRSAAAMTISYCYNEGTINTSFTGGGMGGYLTGATTITGCVNGVEGTDKGAIIGGSGTYLGGIGGAIDNAAVTDCVNYGSVTGTGANKIGGIAGQTGGSGAYTDCYNYGIVKDTSKCNYAGGIIGDNTGAKTISGCKNYADVSGGVRTGGILGGMGVNNVTIKDCVNDANVTGYQYVGGIAGVIGTGWQNATILIDNCSITKGSVIKVTGTISGSGYVGGIAGQVCGNTKATVKNCVNNGEVQATDLAASNDAYVGGIVAHTNGGTYQNNTNNAKITITNSSKLGGIGGIVGRTNAKVGLTNCDNTGDISIDAASKFVLEGNGWSEGVGGIAGNGNNYTFKDCDNSGNIQVLTNSAVGGIHGFADGGITITNCTNSGTVSGLTYSGGFLGYTTAAQSFSGLTNNVTVSGTTVGGILGYSTKGATFTNCTNNGEIKADAECSTGYVGGIAGRVDGAGTFTECINNGPISVTKNKYHVGGIAGYVAGNKDFNDCENTEKGVITVYVNSSNAMMAIGGILGYGNGGTATFDNCVNNAKVAITGNANNALVGGIVGRFANTKSITLTTCDNNGDVNGNYAGGIVGLVQTWGTGYTISFKDCDNTGDVSGAFAAGIFATAYPDYEAYGACQLNINITDCVNDGNIKGSSYAGGIAANQQIGRSSTYYAAEDINKENNLSVADTQHKAIYNISGCVNNGAVESSNGSAGGILADVLNRTYDSVITGCENNGTVSGKNAGGIVGSVYNTITITDCVNTKAVSGTTAGGIVGYAKAELTLSDLTNSASVSGTHAGGIIGLSDKNVTLINCTNIGNITGVANAGGLAGRINGNATVIGCTNGAEDSDSGAVTVTDAPNGGDSGLGGIVGYISGDGMLEGCTNYGKIYNHTDRELAAKYMGGLVGRVAGKAYFGFAIESIGTDTLVKGDACYNYGDLTVNGVFNNNHTEYVGGILGESVKGFYAANCYNYGDIEIKASIANKSSRSGVGGIVGVPYDADNVVVYVESCANYGDITYNSSEVNTWGAGGIIGRVFNKTNGTLTIVDCINEGDITGMTAGGIAGFVQNGTLTITNCHNSGNITANGTGFETSASVNNNQYYQVSAGGLVGYAGAAITVADSTNTGDVQLTSGAKGKVTGDGSKDVAFSLYANAGGLVGTAIGDITVTNSSNEGTVTINSVTSEVTKSGDKTAIKIYVDVAGIVGYTSGKAVMTNVTNSGAITSNADTKALGAAYAGGIAGYVYGAGTFSECINDAPITVNENKYHVGGIAGDVNGNKDFDDCENTEKGVITVKANDSGDMLGIGGILGYGNGGSAALDNCVNNADIVITGNAEKSLVGGIVGRFANAKSITLTNCDNNGDINGKYVGGIVGLVQTWGTGYTISFKNCDNTGDVSGQYAAGIFSTAYPDANPENACQLNVNVVDCTNAGDITGTVNAGGIVAHQEMTRAGEKLDKDGNNISVANTQHKAIYYISGCVNDGNIVSTGAYAGGIAAELSNRTYGTVIENCVNNGTVTAGEVSKDDTTFYVGGIVGYAGKGITFTNCENNNDLILNAYSKNKGGYAAGISGYVGGDAVYTNCVNNGDITTEKDHWYVGGVAGTNCAHTTMTLCVNNGNITLPVNNSWMLAAGGILGYEKGGNHAVKIRSCVNNGTITVTGNGQNACLGGIAGRIYNCTTNISNCINEGDIVTEFTTDGKNNGSGGIIGLLQGVGHDSATVANCVNNGDISGRVAGGIIGTAYPAELTSNPKVIFLTVSTCLNNGAINATYSAGGIVGGNIDDKVEYTIDSCSNMGTVTSANIAGGILGNMTSGSTAKITNSVVLGKISGVTVYGIAPSAATQIDCAYPTTIGAGGGNLMVDVIAIGDKSDTLMAFFKTQLQKKVEEISKFIEEAHAPTYDEFTWADLLEAYENAEAVLAEEVYVVLQDEKTGEWYVQFLTQSRINEAYRALVEAKDGLLLANQKVEVLERTIADAELLYNSNELYTHDSWTAFTKALRDAKAMLADPNVENIDVAEIRDMIITLRYTMENLALGGEIYSASDFAKLEGQSGVFYLMSDITVSAPLKNFSGKIIGNGNTITLDGCALFEKVDGTLAQADEAGVSYAEISDLKIVGDAGGAGSIFGTANGIVKIDNIVLDVENVTNAAIFDAAEKTAEIKMTYVVTYTDAEVGALVGDTNCKVEVHYVLSMGDAPAIVGKVADGSTFKAAYQNGTEYYDGYGIYSADEEVFASGKVAYEMNNYLAKADNDEIAGTTLVQIIGNDKLPAIGQIAIDGINKVVKVDGEYGNAGFKYEDIIPAPDKPMLPKLPVYTGLNSAIARAEAMTKDVYTELTWNAMQKALSDAKNALEETNQSIIDAARRALDVAVASLVKKTTAYDTVEKLDFTALNTAIKNAQALNSSEYTDESWSTLQAMLTVAKVAKRASEQAAIDSAAEALNNAVAGLIKVSAEPVAPETDAPKTTEPADDKGCGSVIGGAAVMLTMVIALGAGITFKKKED